MPEINREPSFLEFLPVSLFGAIMGLTGLSFCWGWAEKAWNFPAVIKTIIGAFAVVAFLVLTVAYIIKWMKYPEMIKKEIQNPVAVSFFATFIISLLLIPGILLPYSANAAVIIWSSGAVLMLLFAWFVLRKWLDNTQEPGAAMPAWIIPIVGTLDVPVVGYRLPIPGIHEICLVFFGIGLVFSVIFLTIIISRLIFQPQLPEALQPTLLILIGPFALAFSVYQSLAEMPDIPASVFFYFDLFLLLIFGSKIFLLAACCPFRVTWWAVGFPLVAFTIAAFRYASQKHAVIFQIIPAVMLAVSTGVIAYLLVQTIYKIITGRFILKTPSAEQATQIASGTLTAIKK
jgi:tellurite resistance protein